MTVIHVIPSSALMTLQDMLHLLNPDLVHSGDGHNREMADSRTAFTHSFCPEFPPVTHNLTPSTPSSVAHSLLCIFFLGPPQGAS